MPERRSPRNVAVVEIDTVSMRPHWIIKHNPDNGWHSVQEIALWVTSDSGVRAFVRSTPWMPPAEGRYISVNTLNRQAERKGGGFYRVVREGSFDMITCPDCGLTGNAVAWQEWWLKSFWPGMGVWDQAAGRHDWDKWLAQHPQPVR